MTLHFQRKPFQSRRVTVFVPWNRIMVMDVVTMTLDGRDAAPPASAADADEQRDVSCEAVHDYYDLRSSVVSLWRHSHLPACSSAVTSLIPQTQVRFRFRFLFRLVSVLLFSTDFRRASALCLDAHITSSALGDGHFRLTPLRFLLLSHAVAVKRQKAKAWYLI